MLNNQNLVADISVIKHKCACLYGNKKKCKNTGKFSEI